MSEASVVCENQLRKLRRKFLWRDHQVLRFWWTNYHQVAEGVYRSNQPCERRYAAFAAMGGRTVLNLRGESKAPFYHFTREACTSLGLNLINISGLSATKAPNKASLLEVLNVFDTAPKPLLIHCKSGADRTGLLSVFYLIDQCGESVAEAAQHLSFKYLHIKRSKSGILDLLLAQYAAQEGQKPLRQWLVEDYEPEQLTRDFEVLRASSRRVAVVLPRGRGR